MGEHGGVEGGGGFVGEEACGPQTALSYGAVYFMQGGEDVREGVDFEDADGAGEGAPGLGGGVEEVEGGGHGGIVSQVEK